MLLTLTATAGPGFPLATDLGYLLHKHPDRLQRFPLSVGTAHLWYPRADEQECTAALLLAVDPIELARDKRYLASSFALGQYLNPLPYAASSLLAVALGRVWSSALHGRCRDRPELPSIPLPLTVRIPACPKGTAAGSRRARASESELPERIFGPLGWQVETRPIPLDETIPEWGASRYVDLTLRGQLRLSEALRHLYVLLPVLDGAKHYWVGTDEVQKLVRAASDWLPDHPDGELIMHRYLAGRRSYVRDAVARLTALEDAPIDDELVEPERAGDAADQTDAETLCLGDVPGDVPGDDRAKETREPTPAPQPLRTSLARQRREAVLATLREVGARSVVDLGCGEGSLLRDLLADPSVERVTGVDVSARALQSAEGALGVERMAERMRARLTLRQSSVTYRDPKLSGYDALVLAEVIEHVDPPRLPDLERNVFGHAHPLAVVVTTPNADYNPCYPGLAPGQRRHVDHRFEWGRAQFSTWAQSVADRYGYAVRLRGIGEADEQLGAPSQLALFTRAEQR